MKTYPPSPLVLLGSALTALGLLSCGISRHERMSGALDRPATGPARAHDRSDAATDLDVLQSALAPDRVDLRADVAGALERRGRFAEAADEWREVVRRLDGAWGETRSPLRGTAHARLAVLAHYCGDTAAARHHLTMAESLDAAVPSAFPVLVETGRAPRARIRTAAASGDGQVVVGPPVRIDSGGVRQATEASVALARSSEVVAAWIDLRVPAGVDAWSLGVGVSLDGGETWTDSLLRPPGAGLTDFEGDPMTLYDPRTGNLWVGGTTFTGVDNIFIARKPPGAAEFEPVVLINQGSFYDRGVLAVGPAPGSPDSTRLYVAHFQGIQWSDDLGTTWSSTRSLPFAAGQHPRVGPQGELYVSSWDFSDGIRLQRSFDGGLTMSPAVRIAQRMDVWDTQDGSRFPGRFRVAPLAFLAIDPNDGTLYCVYFDTTEIAGGDANVDIYFTKSSDQADTWTSPVVVNGDGDPPGDQFFPWLEVDARGHLHLVFVDSRHTVQSDDVEDGQFDVYYSRSPDGGDSWTETRLTPTSFGSAAAAWPGFEQFLGDYVGLSIAGERLVAVYPATFDGDLDVYAQRLEVVGIFSDGFESGDVSAWAP